MSTLEQPMPDASHSEVGGLVLGLPAGHRHAA